MSTDKHTNKNFPKTLEQQLIDNTDLYANNGTSFMLRVADSQEGEGTHIYIHPYDRNGDTVDFLIKGNHIIMLAGGDFDGDLSIENISEKINENE